jgi:RNA polymerase sigma-70 factor, ECF subfamily
MEDPRAEREERFRLLFDATKAVVRAYAWRRAPDLADDIVAETFATAWQHLDAVPNEPLPWLLSVARNARLNAERGDRRRRERESRCAETDVAPPFTDAVEARAEVWAALRQLTERDREILLLAAWERLDRAGLATTLGCSKTAAGVRLFRARKRLAAALEDAADTLSPLAADTRGRLLDEC